jgi:hypothetical protein
VVWVGSSIGKFNDSPFACLAALRGLLALAGLVGGGIAICCEVVSESAIFSRRSERRRSVGRIKIYARWLKEWTLELLNAQAMQ